MRPRRAMVGVKESVCDMARRQEAVLKVFLNFTLARLPLTCLTPERVVLERVHVLAQMR